MKRITTTLAILLLALLAAAPSRSAVTTTNNGDGTTALKLTYTVPTASVATVRDDVCRGIGWTAQVTCTQTMVTAGQCTSGQLGTQVANPQSCLQAIDAAMRAYLVGLRKAGAVKAADDASVAPIRAADQSADITP